MNADQERALVEAMRIAFGSKQCHHHSDMIVEYWNDEYKINLYRKLHFTTERGRDYKRIIDILTDCKIPFEIEDKIYMGTTYTARKNKTIHITIEI